MKTCPFCAEEIQDAAIVCKHCQRDLRSGLTPPAVATPAASVSSPGVAGVLSFLIPGLGQIYRGNVGAGIAFFVGAVIGYLLFIVPGIIVHILAIANAVSGPATPRLAGASAPATAPKPLTPEQSAARDRQTWRIAIVLTALFFAVVGAVVINELYVANLTRKAREAIQKQDAIDKAEPLGVDVSITFSGVKVQNRTKRLWRECQLLAPDGSTGRVGVMTYKESIEVPYGAMRTAKHDPVTLGIAKKWSLSDIVVTCEEWSGKGRVTALR